MEYHGRMRTELVNFIVKAMVYVACFGFSLYGMRALDYEKLLKKNHVAQAQVLYFLLAMALAYLVGSFLLAFLYRGV